MVQNVLYSHSATFSIYVTHAVHRHRASFRKTSIDRPSSVHHHTHALLANGRPVIISLQL